MASSFIWVSLCSAGFPLAHMWCRRHARAMGPVNSEPSDLVQIMIPRWTNNRIEALLVTAQSAMEPEDYIVAVLEGHVRSLNL